MKKALNELKLPGRNIVERLAQKYIAFEDLDDGSPLETLDRVSRTIESLILEDKEIHAVVEEHISRPFFPDAAMEEVVQYIAVRSGRVPRECAELNHAFLEHVMAPRMRFEREALRLHSSSVPLLKGSLELADLFDTLYLEWYRVTVLPMRATVGPSLTREEIADRFRTLKLDHPYTVVTAGDGSFIEGAYDMEAALAYGQRTLAECFPHTVNRIADAMDELRAALAPKLEYFHRYFGCLRSALLCRVPERLEELWREVDEAWIRIPQSELLVPVHMMESGYGDPIRISPEFRIMGRKDEGRKEIEALRASMARLAREAGSPESETRLNQIDISLFSTVLDSGSGLDFRMAGQAVPNRPEVRAKGMKIFLDDHSLGIHAERATRLLQVCTTRATQEWALPEMKKDRFLAYVTGHELGHPVAVTGNEPKELEELKASLLGMQGMMLEGDDEEVARAVAAMALARIVRMLESTAFANPTLRPYCVEAAGLFKALKLSGRLRFKGDLLHFVPDDSGFKGLTKPLFDLSSLILKGYLAKDDQALDALGKEYADLDDSDIATCRAKIDAHI